MSSWIRTAALLAACSLTPAFAVAEEVEGDSFEAPAMTIEVSGQASTPLVRYKHLMAGIEAFERDIAMAPGSTLVLRLVRNTQSVNTKGVKIELVGANTRKHVALAKNGTIIVERDAAALADDAELVVNRKKSALRIQSEVISDGFGSGTRRLGNLRLECKVDMAIERAAMSLLERMVTGALPACGKTMFNLPAWDRGEFTGYSMRDGTRTGHGSDSALGPAGRTIEVALNDSSWSNDTIVTLESRPKKVAAPAAAE